MYYFAVAPLKEKQERRVRPVHTHSKERFCGFLDFIILFIPGMWTLLATTLPQKEKV